MKTCHSCHELKTEEEFNWRNKAKGKRNPTCRECMRLYIRNHYSNNVQYYVDKAVRRRRAYREELHKRVFEYFSTHPCLDCGEADPIVLEFDHIEQSTKTAPISEMISEQRPWKVIMEEIEKCEVRCANCHRRRTAKQRRYYIYLADEINRGVL
jgi:hypothetical protein